MQIRSQGPKASGHQQEARVTDLSNQHIEKGTTSLAKAGRMNCAKGLWPLILKLKQPVSGDACASQAFGHLHDRGVQKLRHSWQSIRAVASPAEEPETLSPQHQRGVETLKQLLAQFLPDEGMKKIYRTDDTDRLRFGDLPATHELVRPRRSKHIG